MRLRARASLVAEQTGPRLLSGCTPVRLRARGSNHLGALVHEVRQESLKLQNGVQVPGASSVSLARCSMSTKLAFQAGKPGASPGRVDVSHSGP